MAKRRPQGTAEESRSHFIKEQYAKIVDYKKTFGSEQGKRVLADMVSAHYMMNPTFTKDPYEMAFKEGSRNVVLRILSLIESDPTKLLNIIKETNDNVIE